MDTFLGIIMCYIWAHSVVIIAKKLQGPTKYELWILGLGFALFILCMIGAIIGAQ